MEGVLDKKIVESCVLEVLNLTKLRVPHSEMLERALMDYVLITKRMVDRLKDVHVFRGVAAGMSDHCLVEAKW